MKNKGFFISFEGGEGTGKSTQMALLAEHLRGRGREVVVTREPGGTEGAEIVRQILLSGAVEEYGLFIETLLLTAARADHVDQLILPALNAGKIVLCDRFIDSTRVYQGREEEGEMPVPIMALEKAAILGCCPDLTFILDLPASMGLSRANDRRAVGERQDRFEKESWQVHESRRQAFLKIAQQEPQRCVVIDAMRQVEIIARDIAMITNRAVSASLGSANRSSSCVFDLCFLSENRFPLKDKRSRRLRYAKSAHSG